jgi:hypothetical protein
LTGAKARLTLVGNTADAALHETVTAQSKQVMLIKKRHV